jgi:hypothetical protein
MSAVTFWRWRASSVIAFALLVSVVCAQPAGADIGLGSVSRSSGTPGQRVQLLIYCGGCLPDRIRLPVSLLPVGSSPYRHPCRGTSCASTAPAPPTSAPYVPLGVASPLRGGEGIAQRLGLRIPDSVERRGAQAVRDWVASVNGLRFRIPDAEPGIYTYVIYCCLTGGGEGRGGDLIGHPNRRASWNRARLANARTEGELLRILPESDSAVARGDVEEGMPWPVVAAAAGALALIALVALRRFRAARPR